MKVIADPETAGVFTRCLAINWGLPDMCQIDGCDGATYAIVCIPEDEAPKGCGALNIAICKKHHEEAELKGRFTYNINIPEQKDKDREVKEELET